MHEPGLQQLTGHLFRREAGRMVSALVRVLGVRHLALAEDAVQDALCRALETWKFGRTPDDPSAWLMRCARNRAIDLLRREGHLDRLLLRLGDEPEARGVEGADDEDQLRLMFSCCDPELAAAAQVALILKYLGGFSVREIASALLSSEVAVEKQLFRARKLLEGRGALYQVDDAAQVHGRLGPVQSAIYLLFNEGYHSSHPELAVREELCAEALRLCDLLTTQRATATAESHALRALLCLHAARPPARLADDGSLLLLAEQERRLWDGRLLAEGVRSLTASATGARVSPFHLEAAIAACHAAAAGLDDTDWPRIAALYDRLLELQPSPVVALNRAIATGMAQGPEAGLAALAAIEGGKRLQGSPFFAAAVAEFELRAGRPSAARVQLGRALALARNQAERDLLQRKLLACAAP